MGDVNKNLTIGETFKLSSSSPTTTEECSDARNQATPSSTSLPGLSEDFSSPRSSSASTTTTASSTSQPSTTSDPSDHLLSETISTDSVLSGSHSKKYRDGLESENFVNKVARFEYLAHSQHSRPPPALPFPTVNSVLYEPCYSDNGDSNAHNKSKDQCNNPKGPAPPVPPKLGMSRPSVSFNRSDQGFTNHLFYTNNSETVSLNSNTTISVVSTPESSSGSCSSHIVRPTYKKAGGGGPPGGSVRFFDDFVNVRPATNATPSPASMDFDEDASLINQCPSSIPSPDSLSSISNHRLYFSSTMNSNNSDANGMFGGASHTSSTVTTKSPKSSSPTDSQSAVSTCDEGGPMTCESLLEIRRKQVYF